MDFGNLNDKESDITRIELKHTNKHFKNRLFDRDTLFLQAYTINFLYLLTIYATNVESSVKECLRKKIRKDFIEFLEGKFDFYLIEPKVNLQDSIDKNFKELNGKIYKPEYSENLVIFALEKELSFENLLLFNKVEKDFWIYGYNLGSNIAKGEKMQYTSINVAAESNPSSDFIPNIVFNKTIESKKSYSILLAVYKNEEHKKWILEHKKYNVRLGDRVGAVKRNHQVFSARYLVLYNLNNKSEYEVYKLDSKRNFLSGEQMQELGYPNKDFNGKQYLLYSVLDSEVDIKVLNLKGLLDSKRSEFYQANNTQIADGAPIYIYDRELERWNELEEEVASM